jgi:hypothetical protein
MMGFAQYQEEDILNKKGNTKWQKSIFLPVNRLQRVILIKWLIKLVMRF